ncbi:hypothetical protein MSAN_01673300 [Mycena sanguinolenta]|uniref:F-box domain-containing protein n=1 Tax=Mycena sanguinolenta TaxID=230812 RepID=A0A8H6XZB4_9AGAR|nr:hypothetical protein MSAN_01673300 [Mycena sanguinolenta]
MNANDALVTLTPLSFLICISLCQLPSWGNFACPTGNCALPAATMSTRTVSEIQPAPQKTRARALSLALIAASKPAPLLDIPTELGLEILELSLTHTPFSTLAAVSRAFSALISLIVYRHIIVDSLETLSLLHRTTKTKSRDFLDTHIKTLAVIIEPWRLTPATHIELEGIVAACTGLRALSVTRPGILGEPLSHRVLPSEVTIQSFDTSPPFQWVRAAAKFTPSAPSSAAASHLTHLRISEPGDTWHSPLSILAFFGAAPHLTHFALARRMDANEDNDQVFVDEVSTLLASRRKLKMIVVRIFTSRWPHYSDDDSAESSSIWAALLPIAEADSRLVLVSAGFNGRPDSASRAPEPIPRVSRTSGFADFWEQSRKDWEARERHSPEQ